MQEMLVQSLGRKIPGEKTATLQYSHPEKYHGERSLTGHSPQGHKRVGHNVATKQQQQTILNLLFSH